MLNLLVSAKSDMWESNSALFPRERCLTEYISKEFYSRFSGLGEKEIKKLKSIPAIFAYESFNSKDAYIGKITGISVREQNVKIDYAIDDRIFYNDFINLEAQLDLGGWELNRTHWTVKNVKIDEIKPYFSSNRKPKPKIFISYCWSPPENQKKVFDLIKKLNVDGISVIYDKKDLKAGQDKNYFMEQALTNNEIDRILVICNRDYAKKADAREGGVGYESEIIISQIASEPLQVKFIPVVMETGKNGKPFLPVFLKSRLYIDLTKENGYVDLLSAIQSGDNEGKGSDD
ncbi:MAG: toll/interleukin-1 receptor domain-containing protein [Spirochaetes bacterium]|nr:toll/interleukin-1 receptor domain-containing protein [Spirochaetota bacterium]